MPGDSSPTVFHGSFAWAGGSWPLESTWGDTGARRGREVVAPCLWSPCPEVFGDLGMTDSQRDPTNKAGAWERLGFQIPLSKPSGPPAVAEEAL